MKMSDSIKQIAPAILKAQKMVKDASKNSNNDFFKSKYANLESVWDAAREALHESGLSCVQTFNDVNGLSALDTMLLHESGEWIMGTQILNELKKDPQAAGAAGTYARRFGLAAIIGIIQADDDGESAMGRKPANLDKDIAIAAQALNHSKTKDEARKIWASMVQPIFHMMDAPTQKLFNDCKDRIVRELA